MHLDCQRSAPFSTLYRFLNRDEEFKRYLLLAAAKCGNNGWILVLLNADDDCPATLGPKILQRAKEIVLHRRVSVVLANREYEAWFLAAAESLDGHRGFAFDNPQNFEPEVPRNAKGWLGERMPEVLCFKRNRNLLC